MFDLFGNERVQSKTAKPIALDLFGAAAERKALKSGRPVSQERTEILKPEPWSAPICPTHGSPLLLEGGGKRQYSCPRCA